MIGAENPQCHIPEVQAQVAKFQLYITLCAGIFAALVTPHLGALSDRIGRKKVITIAACGPFVNEIITIIVGRNPQTVSVYWLLLGAVVDGLFGSFTTSSAVCYSYAADCTAPDRRNVAFGYFHGTLFTGMALGPILAGYLIQWAGDIIIIFYVALACHVFFIVFLNLFVPESLTKDRQLLAREKRRALSADPDHSTWRAFFVNYNFFAPLSVLWPTGHGSSSVIRRNMIFLATIDVLCFGVAMGTMNIIIIYANYVFGWTNLESGQFLSAASVSRVVALLVFLPILTRWVRGPRTDQKLTSHEGADRLDLNIIRLGIFFDLLGYAGYASALSGGVMFASGMVAALGGMASPTLQSALTKHVPADRTGQLLGATGLLHAIARVVSPTIFNLIYAKTVGSFTPAVFVCLASVFMIAEILSWFLKPGVSLPGDYQDPHIAHEDRDRRYFIHRVSSAAVDGIRRRMSTTSLGAGWGAGAGAASNRRSNISYGQRDRDDRQRVADEVPT